MLSIIIPTLNEEKHLPFLLESIRRQNFCDYEIIVADADSADGTPKIAKNFGCKIIKGGFPPGGKNEGADIAQGETILFIDADIILPPDFLQKALGEFKKRNFDLASFYLQSKNKIHNSALDFLYNFPTKLTEKIIPQAMSVFLVKKEIHKAIGGFNEKIKLGEEIDYIRRGRKIGKFGIIESIEVFISSRRFQKDGWLKTWLKYFLCQIYMLFFGPVESDFFRYRFDHYDK